MSGRTSNPQTYLTLILAAVIGVTLFVILGASLGSVWLEQMDHELLSIVRARAERGVSFFELLTMLGSDYVLGAVVLFTGLILYRAARMPELITLAAVGLAAKILEHGLKLGFHRTRPDYVGPTIGVLGDYSFPSGHSLNTAAIYGFVLFLAGSDVRNPVSKYLLLIVGVITIFVVGISRVVLEAHWPSDVIGGWLVGSVVLSVGILCLRHVSKP